MNSPLLSILSKAESLLSQINSVTNGSNTKDETDSMRKYDEPITSLLSYEKIRSDARYDSDDISLLLGGIDDAYGDIEIDDEAVQRIIGAGGNPPSQIKYSSLYAANQRLLNKLSNIKYLNLSLLNMIIYGTEFGIRRENSFITIRTPLGCTVNFNNTEKIYLKDGSPADIKSRVKLGRGGEVHSFLTGPISLDRTLSWNIDLTDEIISCWRKDESKACLYIDLYSSLLPPHKPSSSVPSSAPSLSSSSASSSCCVFARASIPLLGLIAIESLAAITTVELIMEPLVHDAVLMRSKQLPGGVKPRGKSSPPRAGSLRAKLWLQSFDESFAKSTNPSSGSAIDSGNKGTCVLLLPEPESAHQSSHITPSEQHLDAALDYVPSAPVPNTTVQHIVQPTVSPTVQLASPNTVRGLYFHSTFILSTASVIKTSTIGTNTPLKLIVSYKQSSNETDSIEGFGLLDNESDADGRVLFELITAREVKDRAVPKYFEFWVEWIDLRNNKASRKLAGLGSLAAGVGRKVVTIRDIATEEMIGELQVNVHEATDAESLGLDMKTSHLLMEYAYTNTDLPALLVSPEVDLMHRANNHEMEKTVENMRESYMSVDSIVAAVPPRSPAIPEPANNIASKSSIFPTTRVVDISIVSCVEPGEWMADANGDRLGVQVQYSLPPFDAAIKYLWWDAECSVLNGREQHRLSIESPRKLAMFLEQDVIFVIATGEEGIYKSIGKAVLNAATLSEVFQVSTEQTVNLPVFIDGGELVGELLLSIAHHVEPSLLRSKEFKSRVSLSSDEGLISNPASSVQVLIDRLLHLPPELCREDEGMCVELRWSRRSERGEECISSTTIQLASSTIVWDEVLQMRLPFVVSNENEAPLKCFADLKLIISLYRAIDDSMKNILASVHVDLTMLAFGVPVVEGWYELQDEYQCSLGQVKLAVTLSSKVATAEFFHPVDNVDQDDSSSSLDKLKDHLRKLLDSGIIQSDDASKESFSLSNEESMDEVLVGDEEESEAKESAKTEYSCDFDEESTNNSDSFGTKLSDKSATDLVSSSQTYANGSLLTSSLAADSISYDLSSEKHLVLVEDLNSILPIHSVIYSDGDDQSNLNHIDNDSSCSISSEPYHLGSETYQFESDEGIQRDGITANDYDQLPAATIFMHEEIADDRISNSESSKVSLSGLSTDVVTNGTSGSFYVPSSTGFEYIPSDTKDEIQFDSCQSVVAEASSENVPGEEDIVSDENFDDSDVSRNQSEFAIDVQEEKIGIDDTIIEEEAGYSLVDEHGIVAIDLLRKYTEESGEDINHDSIFTSADNHGIQIHFDNFSIEAIRNIEINSVIEYSESQEIGIEESHDPKITQNIADSSRIEIISEDERAPVTNYAEVATQCDSICEEAIESSPLELSSRNSTESDMGVCAAGTQTDNLGFALDLKNVEPDSKTQAVIDTDAFKQTFTDSLTRMRVDKIISSLPADDLIRKPSRCSQVMHHVVITPEFIEAELSRLLPSNASFTIRGSADIEMERVSRIMREIPEKVIGAIS